jgi:murein DD-endopeptidase MepM/ murein hydrolase activator NlpD
LQGVVALAIRDSFPFGNAVIVETSAAILPDALKQEFEVVEGKSLYILYAHLDESSPEVVLGQAVSACETLGYVGKTGNAGAAHLHLETRLGPSGARFPEFSYYREEDSDEARVNYRYWSTSGNFRHFDPMRLLLIELK